PPPGPFGSEDRVAERVSRLREKNLETADTVDWSAVLGVVAVQNTNRSIRVHDRQRHDFGRQQSAEAIDQVDVRGRLAHLALMRFAGLRDVAENRRLVARDARALHARVHVVAAGAAAQAESAEADEGVVA